MAFIFALTTLTALTAAVKLAGDRVRDVGKLLLLLLEILGGCGGGVGVEPVGCLLNGLENLVNLSVKCFADYQNSLNLRSPCHRHQSFLQDPLRR